MQPVRASAGSFDGTMQNRDYPVFRIITVRPYRIKGLTNGGTPKSGGMDPEGERQGSAFADIEPGTCAGGRNRRRYSGNNGIEGRRSGVFRAVVGGCAEGDRAGIFLDIPFITDERWDEGFSPDLVLVKVYQRSEAYDSNSYSHEAESGGNMQFVMSDHD